jgi:hypothetical protein
VQPTHRKNRARCEDVTEASAKNFRGEWALGKFGEKPKLGGGQHGFRGQEAEADLHNVFRRQLRRLVVLLWHPCGRGPVDFGTGFC